MAPLAERALLPAAQRRQSSPTPSAWCRKSSNPTARARWPRPAARRWRSWTPACRSRVPVSGIAMGLIQEGDKHVISLRHPGPRTGHDMDFKVTGTAKASPLCRWTTRPRPVHRNPRRAALSRAGRKARAFILDAMLKIPEPRAELRDTASRTIKIPSTRSATSSAPAARSSAPRQEETARRSKSRKTAPHIASGFRPGG